MRMQTILGLAAAAALAAASSARAKPAPRFLREAIMGDNSEITLGRMAQERAAQPEVRDFGRALQQDHGQARDQALGVARQLGVQPTDAVMPEARSEARKLRHLSGRAFDREFVRYMVGDHHRDIRDFEAQSHGRGPAAELARQTLPMLHKHLDMAERLQR